MKKLCSILVIILSLIITPAFGQMILTEEDVGINPRAGSATPGFGVMVPVQNVTYDQWEYAPIGNGLWLLVGLGGAYLLKKKSSQKKEDRS
ncbi:MAG: hypothetical protein IKM74_07130 [Bacteroidales bacterium]|nr:hypothetical protein [Bacteroidales bacterium]